MNDRELCTTIISLLLGALLASPFMAYWARERDRRKAAQKKHRRKPPGK